MNHLIFVLLATALVITACAGGAGGQPAPGVPGASVGAGVGPGISVEEALDAVPVLNG